MCIEDSCRIKKLTLEPEYDVVIVVDGGYNREWLYFTLNSVLGVKKAADKTSLLMVCAENLDEQSIKLVIELNR